MIEVERKFKSSEWAEESIKRIAKFISSKIINDVLYDFEDLRLIKTDRWLRSRDGAFELKLPLNCPRQDESMDIYDEIVDEPEIKRLLEINDFETLSVIARLETKRNSYKLNEFNIVFNNVSSRDDDFAYSLMEIELLAEDLDEADTASKKIKDLAKELGIPDSRPEAKAVRYFHEKNITIYNLLMRK